MKNKDLDKILKQLGDFDPQAKPNWEAFVADKESLLKEPSKIPGTGAGNNFSRDHYLRNAGFALIVVAGLLLTWYYSGNTILSPKTEENTTPQKIEKTIGIPEQIPENIAGPKPVEQPVSVKDQANHEKPQPEMQIEKTPVHPNKKTEKQANTPDEPRGTSAEKDQTSQPAKSNTVTVTDTVYVKKTIHITDTVKRK